MKSLQFMLCDNILTSKCCWISVCAWRKHIKQMSKQFRSLRRDYIIFFQNILAIIGQKNNVFLNPLIMKIKQVSYLLATDYLRKI